MVKRLVCPCGAPCHVSRLGRKYPRCLKCKRQKENTWRLRHLARFKDVQRKSRLKKVYGVSVALVDKLLAKQKGECAICCKRILFMTDPQSTCKAHVDHDHQTGRVRGILCANCNWLLGQCYDDEGILFAAIEYLRRVAA